jgi:hypothetical protein
MNKSINEDGQWRATPPNFILSCEISQINLSAKVKKVLLHFLN